MAIEEVIKKGRGLDLKPVDWQSVYPDWYLPLAVVILIIVIGLAIYGARFDSFMSPHLILSSIILVVFLLATTDFQTKAMGEAHHEKYTKYNKWVDESVKPYLESLPQEKKAIAYIKLKEENEIQKTPSSISIPKPTKIKQTYTLGYNEDGDLKLIEVKMKVKMDLESGEKPYFTYVTLDKKLGEGYDKGIIIRSIHLPEDYHFTDMQ